MVSYIKSDLEFILAQIKIAEAHAGGQPLYGPGGLIPSYNLSWGLRTVDGTYNNLLHPTWGSADTEFPEPLGTNFRPADGTSLDMDGPGPAPAIPTAANCNPSNNPDSIVVDSSLRTISNLIVDQTLGNPAAILTALQRAGIVAPENQMTVTAQITAAFEPIEPLFTALTAAEVTAAAAIAAAAANPADPDLAAAAVAAEAARVAAATALTDARAALDTLLEANGVELDGANVSLPNVAPDEGLSAPFNSWFTLFGQFFDHGLDLVNKGGSGTVFIPLQPDDPLYVEGSATNFMVLTRATVSAGQDGVMGTADDVRPVNTTTAFVDQNQTYTSHSSHQVFLRQYVLNDAGDPVATGKLIEGGNGGMATWADVKAQAADLLGIQLIDSDVGNIPLLAADQYGKFIPGPNGFPQMVFPGANPGDPPILVEGDPTANAGLGVLTAGAIRTGHAFLADIAHNAVPTGLADGDIEIGLGNPDNSPTDGQYDNELLDAHYIAGDGRANENIGLTAVHHVFHSEHNRLMEHTKAVVLATGDNAFIQEWLIPGANIADGVQDLEWNGERLFQAAKFGTEMQYQHLVFEEFARKIQPNINVFLVPDGFDVTIDPSIVAEFAHVVYRFGHSMLTETIDRFDPTFTDNDIGLIEGFLNPIQFETNGTNSTVDANVSAGAIIRGMTRQVGNEIDEFVTGALRNNLLGLPLDLATINLARGRDTGVPSLNAARRSFYEATNEDAQLKPYESWVDFAGHLKNEASIINFVAAYGLHSLITSQTTIEGKRDAALTIITGISVGGLAVPADAVAFLNSTGTWANAANGVTTTGLDNVDLWIGGLAEEIMPFGGMLGSTFNFVFETQMEKLQNGDRFYYLQRLDGLHLFGEMEGNSFAAMIMRNTDSTHLPSDVFSTPGLILEVDRTKQFNPGLGETAGADGILADDPNTAVNEALDNLGNDPVGTGILTQLVIRDNPLTPAVDTNYLRYTGGDHVVLGGTDAADILIAGIGDDTLFGDGGNDNLEGGFGNDIINGGDGDDIIRDAGGDDNIKAGAGNDVVHAGPGLDLVLAGSGQDFVVLGTDMGSEVFGGEGNDFILGNKNAERILGNEGNDWIETGTFDGAPGDNFDEIFAHDGIDGHDVFLGDGGFDEFIGEGGDDIMVGSPGRGKMAGMSGFDWVTYKDNALGVNANLSLPIIFDEAPTLPQNSALDEFESMEGLSGTKHNDILTGSEVLAADRLPLSQGGSEGYAGSALDAQGIALINGLQALLGAGVTSFSAGDIILGGDGSDLITGLAGDDIIDGDKWLDVQIGVFAVNDPDHTGTPIALHSSMTTLASSMFSGAINPGQLAIVRTIRTADGTGDTDVAVFSDDRENYDLTFDQDGTITVAHTRGLATDGTDTVRNVEVLRFADGDLSLLPPALQLHAFDLKQYLDQFGAQNYSNSNGATLWTTSWVETSDNNSAASGQIQITGGELRFDQGDGASIQRGVNLAGATTARLSYNVNPDGLDAGEQVTVFFSADGVGFTLVDTISGDGPSVNRDIALVGPFTANAAIRIVTTGISEGNEVVDFDNVAITSSAPAAAPTVNYETTFTEGGTGVAIAAGPGITDDGTLLASARIVLTNAMLGDSLSIVGGLPAGISGAVDTSVEGQITVNLIGTASLALYQNALQAVRFSNNSQAPGAVDRIVQVTVNDGFLNSNVATTTINVVDANDAPTANNDTVITNVAANIAFAIPEWALLANDTDPEGSVLDVTVVGGANGVSTPSLVTNPGSVTLSDTSVAGGTFTYTASDGAATDGATVTINRVTGNTLTGTTGANTFVGDGNGSTFNGLSGNDVVIANAGNDTINGGTGDDRLDGGAGIDLINWNANATGDIDGFDIVDGGANTDTFDVNTRAFTNEIYRVYTNAAAVAAGMIGLAANTEIVITRTVGGTTSVIAELDNIEEIRIGTQTTDPIPGGAGGGDTVQIFGDFSTTSLALNTITITGNAGDDTVDISALTSAHRIVFKSNGGNDTIIGTLRAEDVIELAPGKSLADYDTMVNQDGTTTLSCGDHKVTYLSAGSPTVREFTGDVTPVDPEIPNPGTLSPGNPPPAAVPNEAVWGGGGHDRLVAGAGNDALYGRGGHDRLYGGDGNDNLYGHGGHDRLNGGTGSDRMWGSTGNDVYVVDGAGDRVVEKANQGIDSVRSSVSHTLSANIEKLLLTGSADINGTGNSRANVLQGNAGDNVLKGGGGADVLKGMSGDDRLVGGTGDDWLVGGNDRDTFVFQQHGGRDTVTDFRDDHDRIDASGLNGVNGLSDLTLTQVGGNVEIHHGNDVLVLEGVLASDLDNKDFIF